ncbi:uncharacterized protein LOC115690253 [Syzygium oleosum]|uniref:uncharacterized protein LOC115690253 n=1 Tax=Syzygium oleosum TaxID=219896 RepID=UPI0024BAEDEE|nr:uncharacterized protein LOC115690253 [Syzygium oleosum]
MDDPHRKWSQKKATTFETTIWAIKIALICLGIGSSLILFKIAVIPYTSTFLVSTIPCFWSSIKVFFAPPYIYILLNIIIAAIVASSTFHHQSQIMKPVKRALLHTEKSLNLNFGFKREEDEAAVFEVVASQDATKESHRQDQEWKNITFTQNQEKQEEVIKPMVVVASVDKNVDPSTETSDDEALSGKSGKLTGETAGEEKVGSPKPEEPDDSLDSVWMAIMESQGRRATRQLKKSDTWDSPPRVVTAARAEALPPPPTARPCRRELRKSDTFRERVTNHDELHRRADEFIRKTNNDLRLQREESNQRYIERVNRGVY